MNWIDFLWPMVTGACLTLGLINLRIGFVERPRAARLLFSLSAFAVALVSVTELAMMRAETPARYLTFLKWGDFATWLTLISLTAFVWIFFRAGNRWLALAGPAIYALGLPFNLEPNSGLVFSQITRLKTTTTFGGATYHVAEGVPNPWNALAYIAVLLIFLFTIDSSVRLWRRGFARRAFIVGGSLVFFLLAGGVHSALIERGLLHSPYLISWFYLAILVAMGHELTREVFAATLLGRELRESEVRMNLAANAGNLGLWMWDIPRDYVWLSEKGRNLFGFAAATRIDLNKFVEMIHADDRERMRDLVQSTLSRGGEYEDDYRITLPNAETRWIYGYGRVEFDRQGKPIVMRGVVRDITKRKLAEEALRESEARFRTVADVAPVMIWMSGPDKLCNFFNKGWLEFTGRTPAEEFGNGWAEGVHAEDLEHCLNVYGKAVDAREPFTMEYRLRRKDGEYRWVLDNGTPRFDAGGVFVGYIGSCLDIADRKQAELEHQLQSMELARVGRLALMGELAASLAHEVNNPLGAMVTNASAGQRMIAHGQMETEELQELLADIISDGHRAREVIEGIRNMVRKSETTRSLVSMNEVIHDLLRIIRADATARKVTLVAQVDANAGVVLGDRVQLLQVLLNLTMNAFEALSVVRTDARCALIRAERVNGGQVCVWVRDRGPGFLPGIVEQLFEPFFTTKAEGTGMGLAIARTIIEAHGGTLSGANCDDGGAIFTLCLPEATAARSEAA